MVQKVGFESKWTAGELLKVEMDVFDQYHLSDHLPAIGVLCVGSAENFTRSLNPMLRFISSLAQLDR